MSAARDATVAAVTLARNYIAYGVAVNGAAIEGIEAYAPVDDIVSGPLALTSAVQVVGWQAQYSQAYGYILRALTNSSIVSD
jgi:hypothetical protein